MKQTFPLPSASVSFRFFALSVLLLGFLGADVLAQSGRRNARTSEVPIAPVQAPIFSQPEPEPRAAAVPMEPAGLGGVLTESLLQRKIKALDDSTFHLGDFSDKVVVVNLWASWCGPCRREVPEYEKVRKDYAGSNVEFIGLTDEDQRAASDSVRKFVRDLKFGFRIGWIDRDTARALSNGRASIPQTLVITPSGRIVSHWNGYMPGKSGDRLRNAIEKALQEASEQKAK
jgi:thiol-disulfide isomerase/thioredoxin